MDLTHLNALQAVMISLSGFMVVFLMLVMLWGIIYISTKVLEKAIRKDEPAAPQEEVPVTNDMKDTAIIAAAIAAMIIGMGPIFVMMPPIFVPNDDKPPVSLKIFSISIASFTFKMIF